MGETDTRLEREARALYRVILKRDPDRRLVDRYVRANHSLCGDEEIPRFSELVDRGVDLEAMEFAWRLKDARNPLTRKVHIMIYLAEAIPVNFPAFFNSRRRRFGALFILFRHFLRSVYKGVKGLVLLKRWKIA